MSQNWKNTLANMETENKKALKRFQCRILRSMPKELIALYERLNIKEKLYAAYFFSCETSVEAAMKAGYPYQTAHQNASIIRRKVAPLLQFIEEQIVDQVMYRTIEKNIVTREFLVEKLAKMIYPDIGDLEDYTEAKKRGYLAAAKEVEVRTEEDPETGVKKTKRYITKMVDQRAVIETICKILGYHAPASGGEGSGGNAAAPTTIIIQQQPVAPPKIITVNKPVEAKAIPVDAETIR